MNTKQFPPGFSFLAVLVFAGLCLALVPAKATELIVNGNFETGSTGTGWTLSGVGGGSIITTYASLYHSATHYLWFGNDNGTDTAYQDITIPANASVATLSFYYNINSSETAGAPDTFSATIRNPGGAILATVTNWSNLNGTTPGNYSQLTYNLSSYAGQTIRLYFASACTLTGGKTTNFRIDDVSVSVTTSNTNQTSPLPCVGKGDWIHYLVPDGDGNDAEINLGESGAQALFNYEASQGVKWVVVKAQDGTTTGAWGYSASVVTAAHNAGLKIFAFGYLYGNYYGTGREAAELSATLGIISSTSPDGFIIDAEAEYDNQPGAAAAYASGFKAAYPNLFLAYAPFVDITIWPNFPYIQFGQYCDAVMPQAYFELGSGYSPSGIVSYMDGQWSSWQNGLMGTPYAGSIKPIIPICQAYNDEYFTDNGLDLVNFVNDLQTDATPATAGGYPGVSFFDADAETSGMRMEIAEATIGSTPVSTTYTVTVSASPSGGGTVGGGGPFVVGSSQTVTATVNAGYTFASWTENGSVVSSSASYVFALNGNRNLVANFNVITPPTFGGASINAGKLQTMLSGLSAGETVVFYRSANLQNWTPFQTNAVIGSTITFTNTINPAMPGQYFRAGVH